MAHGHPDYGDAAPTSTVSVVTDLGELAARLGSPVTFDRRGNVLWYDDFEAGMTKWGYQSLGTGAIAEWLPYYSHRGRGSIKLTPSSDADRDIYFFHEFMFYGTPRIGIEVSYTLDQGTQYFKIYVLAQGGWPSPSAAMRVCNVTGRVEVLSSGGGWLDIGSLPGTVWDPRFFNTAKLVVDFGTKKYVRVILNNKQIDTAVDIFDGSGGGGTDWYWLAFNNTCEDVGKIPIYIDDAIITINEP